MVVAFSGGVDSSVLLLMAQQVLGKNVLAITIDSDFVTREELVQAKKLAKKKGIRTRIIRREVLENKKLKNNPRQRCYFCKKAIMKEMLKIAQKQGACWVVEGSNADDAKCFRPGKRALAELGIKSPLAWAGLTKAEVRSLAKQLGLDSWNKPSSSCLATRFPYGSKLSEKKLQQAAQAEKIIRELGFAQVRVRVHEETARIEVEKHKVNKLLKLIDQRLIRHFKKLGYEHVCIDAAGYKFGSMDTY